MKFERFYYILFISYFCLYIAFSIKLFLANGLFFRVDNPQICEFFFIECPFWLKLQGNSFTFYCLVGFFSVPLVLNILFYYFNIKSHFLNFLCFGFLAIFINNLFFFNGAYFDFANIVLQPLMSDSAKEAFILAYKEAWCLEHNLDIKYLTADVEVALAVSIHEKPLIYLNTPKELQHFLDYIWTYSYATLPKMSHSIWSMLLTDSLMFFVVPIVFAFIQYVIKIAIFGDNNNNDNNNDNDPQDPEIPPAAEINIDEPLNVILDVERNIELAQGDIVAPAQVGWVAGPWAVVLDPEIMNAVAAFLSFIFPYPLPLELQNFFSISLKILQFIKKFL